MPKENGEKVTAALGCHARSHKYIHADGVSKFAHKVVPPFEKKKRNEKESKVMTERDGLRGGKGGGRGNLGKHFFPHF